MGDQTLITDLVSQKAFDQLTSLNKEIVKTKETYISLIKEIAANTKLKPTTFDELREKTNNYNSSVEKLNVTVSRLKEIQEKMLKVSAEINAKIKEGTMVTNNMVSSQKEQVQTTQQAVAVNQRYEESEVKISKANNDNITTINRQSKAYKDALAAADSILGTYDKNLIALRQLREATKELTKAQQELDEKRKAGAVSYNDYIERSAELSRELRDNKVQISDLESVLKNQDKIFMSSSTSTDRFRLELVRMRDAYRALNDEGRKSDAGILLKNQINELDPVVKKLNTDLGDNTILVGSYTESILKAFGVNNKFTKGLIDASAGGKGLNGVLQAGTVAVKGFSKQLLALLANPVVLTVAAIVAAFAALVAVFNSIINVAKSNEEQYYKLEKAMTPIRAISDMVTVGFEKLADKVIKITSAILGNIAAFTDWIGLTNGLQKQSEKYADISEKRKNLMQDERNALVANAKAEKEIAKLRDDAADKQKYTFEERANLLEKAIKKEEEILKRNENIAQRKVDLLKQEIENRGKKASTEELDALAQAEANLYEVQKHSYQRRRELTAQRTQFLKQAAQEQENINKNLQKSTIDLLEEGYEKQKARLILEYDDHIKNIKGNSDEELETRKNLEKQKQKALLDLEIDFNREREKINIENRLNYVKEGSIEELDLRTKLLEIQKEIEIKNAEKTGADKLLIEQKYNNLIDKENEKKAKIQANEILNRYSFEAAARNSAYLEEKKRLSQQLKENKISRKDYDEQIYKLDNEFSRKSVEMAIESYEAILKLSDLSDEERLNATQKLAELKGQLSTLDISDNENYKKGLEKWLDDNQEYLEKAMELFNQFGEFVNAIFDNRIQKIEEEQEAIEERYDKEVDAIESLADKGAISTEEAEARKRAAEERTAEKTKQLEKEKAKLQERQAIFQKGMNISNIIMDTSLAIMKAWSQGGIFAAPMVALIAALGAAQLATVIAQPIPKYAKGTDNHPGGPAIVGDGGKHELVMYDKSMFVTPNVPVLMNLPKGSKVIPNISDLDFLRGVAQSDFNLMKRETDPAIIFNNNNGEVIRAINETNKLLADFMKQMHKDAYNKEYQEYLRRKS